MRIINTTNNIVVRRKEKQPNSIVINGVTVPEEFYEPFEKEITEEYFFNNCLPVMEKFGQQLEKWASGNYYVFSNDKDSRFMIINNIDTDKNPWAKIENMSERLKLLLTLRGEL
jgi:hypothetical protein